MNKPSFQYWEWKQAVLHIFAWKCGTTERFSTAGSSGEIDRDTESGYNIQPLVLFSFFAVSARLFKKTVLCSSTDITNLHLHTHIYQTQGSLNRDRIGLKSGWTKVGAFRARGQYWNPQRSGQGHKGQSEWRKRKRVWQWGSTYWKHGQPTASTTAFFWSWLSLAVLLKFHKMQHFIRRSVE